MTWDDLRPLEREPDGRAHSPRPAPEMRRPRAVDGAPSPHPDRQPPALLFATHTTRIARNPAAPSHLGNSQIGNHGSRIRAGLRLIQRQSGLANEQSQADYVGAAHQLWRSAKADLTVDAFLPQLVALLKLPFPVEFKAVEGGGNTFDHRTWTFMGRKDGRPVRDLDKAEVVDLVNTVYHECRHSEQRFRVHQIGGRAAPADPNDEMSPDLLAALDMRAKSAAPLNDDEIEEARGWQAFFFGPFRGYRSTIFKVMDASKILKRSEDQQDVKAGEDIYEKTWFAYKAFLDEADAFKVGDDVGGRFAERPVPDYYKQRKPVGEKPREAIAKGPEALAEARRHLRDGSTALQDMRNTLQTLDAKDEHAAEVGKHITRVTDSIDRYMAAIGTNPVSVIWLGLKRGNYFAAVQQALFDALQQWRMPSVEVDEVSAANDVGTGDLGANIEESMSDDDEEQEVTFGQLSDDNKIKILDALIQLFRRLGEAHEATGRHSRTAPSATRTTAPFHREVMQRLSVEDDTELMSAYEECDGLAKRLDQLVVTLSKE